MTFLDGLGLTILGLSSGSLGWILIEWTFSIRLDDMWNQFWLLNSSLNALDGVDALGRLSVV